MRQKDQARAAVLEDKLIYFHSHKRGLPGIALEGSRSSLVEQIVESIRRIEYVKILHDATLSPLRADPTSDLFDPLRAAELARRAGNNDEAFWLIFLSVHFGKHKAAGWRLARDVYGSLGQGLPWTWDRISTQPMQFRNWLADNVVTLQTDGVSRHFGNHRKYESLRPDSSRGTGTVVESYVNWVAPPRTHMQLIQQASKVVGGDPRKLFDYLYHSLNIVVSFGRTARFDYLTMVGNLGLAPVEPGFAYLNGATGPFAGARLLFGGSTNADISRGKLETMLAELDTELGVGMQVLEDSLCNWQKSPDVFRPFRG